MGGGKGGQWSGVAVQSTKNTKIPKYCQNKLTRRKFKLGFYMIGTTQNAYHTKKTPTKQNGASQDCSFMLPYTQYEWHMSTSTQERKSSPVPHALLVRRFFEAQMKLRQQVPRVFHDGRVRTPKKRLPKSVETLDAKEIFHHNMILHKGMENGKRGRAEQGAGGHLADTYV